LRSGSSAKKAEAPAIELPEDVGRAVEIPRRSSTATDYFIIASGNSDVQVKAIADHILEELNEQGTRAQHAEGLRGGRWVLLDYIDFVVHVFHPQARSFYQLENLWGDAPRWDAPEVE
jgi:ribosome-associated protein